MVAVSRIIPVVLILATLVRPIVSENENGKLYFFLLSISIASIVSKGKC